jgi:hypothetical protein
MTVPPIILPITQNCVKVIKISCGTKTSSNITTDTQAIIKINQTKKNIYSMLSRILSLKNIKTG